MSNGGNPLVNQPPTTVTVSDVTQQEVDPRKKSELEALGRKDAGEFNTMWAARAAHITDAPGTVASMLVGILDSILAAMMKVLTAAQGEKNSSFYDLAAAVVKDLTGTDVDAEALKQSTFGSGRLAGMEALGGDLYNLLEDEFKPASGDLEAGDTAPAEKFLGFLMNFAIRQGNVETILSLIPEEYRFLDGIRTYGELMAKNLGLGRMARRALQPLIQILVADPLMYKLQEDYRPKRIGAMPAIKKYFRDATFEQQMRKELAQEGYTDARIDDLITDYRPLLSERHLVESLFRFGNATVSVGATTTASITDLLAQRGYSAADIDRLTASTYMGMLGYDDTTAELVLSAHSLQHQHARQLGLAQLKKAFHDNVIDLLELKAHLTTQGYSDDDIQIITLDLVQPVHGKVRQLSLAEIKAGLKAGVLTQGQAMEHLKTLGFSDADITVLMQIFPGPPAPATAGTTASTPATPPAAG